MAPAPKFNWGPGIKTLIIGGGASHDYQRWFNLADVRLLNEAGGISANYTEQTGGIADLIASVDVLVLSNNKPFTDKATRDAIFRHLAAGKGIVGLHAGVWYNWADWPEYNQRIAGGGARGHDRLGKFEVVLKEPNHPLVASVPSRFEIVDELYWFEADPGGSKIRVLATAHSAEKDKTYPQVFTVDQERGRVVVITLGHDGQAHSHEAYQKLLVNAVRWAGTT